MKKKLFTLLTLLVAVCSGAWAVDYTELFSVTSPTNNSQTQNNVTVSSSNSIQSKTFNGTASNVYKIDSNPLNITSTTINIRKIEFTACYSSSGTSLAKSCKVSTSSDGSTFATLSSDVTVSGGTGTTSTSTAGIYISGYGGATTVTVVFDNAVRYIRIEKDGKETWVNSLKVYAVDDDPRTAVTLSFPNATEAATLGGSFTAPTLTVNPTAAASEVAYSSSNTSVATVDASTGAVTLKAGGSTTITAKIENSTTYKDATASYTLNVTDPDIKNVTATWAFNTGVEGQTAVISVDDIFSSNTVSIADMKYNGSITWGDPSVTGTKMRPLNSASDNKSQYVRFTLVPKKGITFSPTSISFDAIRVGTDGSNKLHYYVECGNTSTSLGNVNPNRNDASKNTGDDKNTWSHYQHDDISGIDATKENPLSLSLYVYGLGTNKDIAFANIVIEGTYSGEAEDETMYTVTTSVTPAGAGTVTQTPNGTSLSEGTAVSFTATANEGYAFLNKWTVNSNEEEGETYNIASLAENTTVVAQFKKLYTVSYNKTAEGVLVGTCNEVLGEEYANASNKWTAPINQYMTKAGYTFVNWKDADNNEYTPGTEYELTEDITITPQFVENKQSLAMRTEAIEVTWNFRNSSVYFNSQGNTQYYVKQATINNETVDIPMYCNTTNGKLNNTNRTDGWIQANGGTVLTIPAVKGMTVAFGETRYEFGRSDKTATTVGGEEPSSKSGDSEYHYSASFTYNGTAETVDIAIGSDISYMSTITVTYPKNATFVDVSDAGYRTFASSSALDFTDGVEGLTAYRAVVIGDKVSFVAINGPVPAKEGMLLKAAKGRYYIPLASGTPAEIENEFVGVTSAEEVGSGIFVLYADDTHPIGFYKTSTTFTVSKNTAYLPASVSEARSFIALDEESTGIAEMEAVKNVENAKFYNLAGQRVAQPTKGMYIVNGKKVIMK